MTWITDNTGRRWVEVPLRARRRSPRAVRFADIKVGDQLMAKQTWDKKVTVAYSLVTDLWFDPVAGQYDDTAGRMVAIQRIDARTGEPHGRKQSHTVRGLASQGFHYADVDFMTQCKLVLQGKADGAVIGIGFGHTIRRRPKVPGPRSL